MPTAPRSRSPYNRPRWTVDDAREVLRDLARSGKPVGAFAAERGLDPQRVYLWRRRLGGVTTPTAFEEVVLRAAGADAGESGGFEIVLRSGHVLRVPTLFEPAVLRRLLDVLDKASGC